MKKSEVVWNNFISKLSAKAKKIKDFPSDDEKQRLFSFTWYNRRGKAKSRKEKRIQAETYEERLLI